MSRRFRVMQEARAEERRVDRRRALYLGEGFTVRLELGGGARISGEAVSLSGQGMAVAIPRDVSSDAIVVGETVRVSCELPGYPPFELKAVIANKSEMLLSQRRVARVGLKYIQERRQSSENFRKSLRIRCPEFFHPLAYCEHPLFFKEHIHFQVDMLSSNGMELSTSARNKAFVVGMPLKLRLLVPMQGEFRVGAVVRSIRQFGEQTNRYALGVQIVDAPKNLGGALAEYLSSCTQVSLRELRESGFDVDSMEKALTFDYVSTEEEWRTVLQLRFRAYKAAGKFGSAKTADDMSDEFDHHSRHLICRQGGKIVASLRLVFINGDRGRCEHAKLGVRVPDFLGTDFVEISRACTDPDYRGSDIFLNLIRHAARITFQAGFRYMLMNCNDNMWPVYKKAGARKTGVVFDAFGTTNCSLIYVDLHTLFEGSGGGIMGWHFLTFPMADYINRRKSSVKARTKVTLMVNRYAAPVMRGLMRYKKAFSKPKKR